jgi:hypothetical protein
MEEIINILMRRDHLSRQEALDLYDECQEVILETLAENRCSIDDLEMILEDYLGLEPDYLPEFLM